MISLTKLVSPKISSHKMRAWALMRLSRCKKSEPVTEITPELRQLAKDMLETMYDAPGCGLAAPQIGKNIRLVVIDTAIPGEEDPKPYIMFNPEWEAEEDAKPVDYDEGCLSFPDIFCNVVRPTLSMPSSTKRRKRPMTV